MNIGKLLLYLSVEEWRRRDRERRFRGVVSLSLDNGLANEVAYRYMMNIDCRVLFIGDSSFLRDSLILKGRNRIWLTSGVCQLVDRR